MLHYYRTVGQNQSVHIFAVLVNTETKLFETEGHSSILKIWVNLTGFPVQTCNSKAVKHCAFFPAPFYFLLLFICSHCLDQTFVVGSLSSPYIELRNQSNSLNTSAGRPNSATIQIWSKVILVDKVNASHASIQCSHCVDIQALHWNQLIPGYPFKIKGIFSYMWLLNALMGGVKIMTLY